MQLEFQIFGNVAHKTRICSLKLTHGPHLYCRSWNNEWYTQLRDEIILIYVVKSTNIWKYYECVWQGAPIQEKTILYV